MDKALLAGKKRTPLNSLGHRKERNYSELFFANEELSNLSNITAERATFINLSGKGVAFSDCNFSYAIFINCYFRGATFKNCNFTGAKFYECNFRQAKISNCDLSYSHWKETIIEKQTVLANLPRHENVAQELLIGMRINASSVGEYDDARAYIYESERQSRRYNLRKMQGAENYYKKKYSADQRVAAFIRYLRSHIERLVWGYGEKVLNLAITAMVIVSLFGLLYLLKEQSFFLNNPPENIISGYIKAFMVSLSVFTGFSLANIESSVRDNLYSWFLFEALFGLIFIGFLAASLHRRISMRRD